MKAIALSLSDPSTWPLRMTIDEVAHVSRRCRRTVEGRIKKGLMFPPDSDGMFERDQVVRYLRGGLKDFDEAADRAAQRQKRGPRLAVSR